MLPPALIVILALSTASVSGFNAGLDTHKIVGLPPIRRRFSFHEVRLSFSAGEAVDGELVVDDVKVPALPPSRHRQPRVSRRPAKFSKQPPWLQRIDQSTPEQVEIEVKVLEYSMIEHGFSVKDVADVVKAIYFCAMGEVPMIIGSIEFSKLLLRLEEPGQGHNFFVTKDVLLASILHYSEGVTARRDGVYQKVQKALGIGGAQDEERTIYLESPLNSETDGEESNIDDEKIFPKSTITLHKRLSSNEQLMLPGGVELFTMDALRLARGASRIKRAEILGDVVLTDNRAITTEAYADLRDLLLSVVEDWRSLAIRCVAYLYRLEGVLHSTPQGTGEYLPRSHDAVLAARHSIRIYANLSQRLGLHRLKSQLEGSAFRILYPRQFSAVSSLFTEKGEAMNSVSTFLSSQITKMVHEDKFLMSKLEHLEISSRVKEPYSFWKKLLQKRQKQHGGREFLAAATEISVVDVQDGVALRVILKACKLSSDESIETTRLRERMLCYYVHHLIRSRYPAIDPSRIKDYIQDPKPNGYQSLHHTSAITHNNQEFPFEVQVRSDEMHHIAEFGLAAHFDYKIGSKSLPALAPAPESGNDKVMSSSSSPAELSLVSDERSESEDARESAYISAIEKARHTLVQSNVFVFLPGSSSALKEGQLLSLPAGAQVVDILAEVRRKYGVQTDANRLQVRRNGKFALLDECVSNGDVLLLKELPARELGRKSLVVS